ncbi:poly [ADP-ribose] polymerase [Galleria mellonella]|uniref:Poly [ADP-ribose] polymerase n=1 Tax=Galleria mellonella TaxID=7137 RepID=A0A6J1WD57_GALME|nr:poly [ADP-ribose] polymerase [Galleria mellonella]
MTDLPYQVEYAKSGRASCKGCKEKIDQGLLRIARMVQSAFHDGKQPNWYHEDCFFTKQRPASVDEISNFNKLKSSDQKKLQSRIEDNSSGVVLPSEETKGKKRKAGKSSEAASGAVKDFAVEYSKSSRATCKHCEIKICKGEVRISKTVFDTEIGAKYGGQPLWHHVKCFAEARSELLYFAGGESLPGFKTLKKEDQKMIADEIKPFKSDEVPVKKLKNEPKDPEEVKATEKKQKLIDKQNKLYHKYKNALVDITKKDLQAILEENSQASEGLTKSECEDSLADCMAFGALEPCPECKNGQLVLDTFGYKCTGHISDWTKCTYMTQNPKRIPLQIPSLYKKNAPFDKYKPKVDRREFKSAPPPVTLVNIKPEASVKKEIRIPPLKNLQFFIYGKFKTPKEDLKHRILKLGGLVVTKLTETTAAVVSSKKEIEKMNEKMEEIKAESIEVIDESFFDLIDPENGTVKDTLRLIKENNIADWGSDPATRIPQDVIDGKSIPKSGSMYVKSSKSTSVKLKIQDGTAVDPDSGLVDCAHVYKDSDGAKYTVVLSKTDIVTQKNSYYKLQLLESDNKNNFWVFRSWGRIGTTIGGNKVQNFKTLHEAKKDFCFYYSEKTQNDWEDRDDFVKVPGCYYPLDVDYGDSEETNNKSREMTIDKNSSLPIPVQKLIQRIFDMDAMKKTLLEFELDTEKMPLGKLSQKQIKTGYQVLSELLKYIEKGKVSQNKVMDATNRFFTLIPHDFGMNNAPLLDNTDIIKSKCEMLDNMLEIEIAYSMLSADKNATEVSPLEGCYRKLKTEIVPLDVNSEEYQMISEYTKNTHAATHSSYKLQIQQVFKVVREGEDKRYKPFKKLHNRRLLWHGSRVTNFAGILSQGLRIAPPEAPVTGYMFGKGIYFADMVSKSANYCCTNKQNPVGVMLLCEVALGNMKECDRAEYVTKLPADRHSVWGRGRTEPDPALARTLPDGTLVPLGPPITVDRNVSLLYNEYIVYDVAQVNVKYLMEMKFDFNY